MKNASKTVNTKNLKYKINWENISVKIQRTLLCLYFSLEPFCCMVITLI